MAEPEFVESMQWCDKLPSLPSWPSCRKGKKPARNPTDSNCVPVPKRKCSTRSRVGHMFTLGATAALIKDAFTEQVGVFVSQDTPKSKEPSEVMDYLLDVSLMELEPDREPEPVLVPENPETIVSVVEKERLPVDNVSSGSNCKRSTAPGCPKRLPSLALRT